MPTAMVWVVVLGGERAVWEPPGIGSLEERVACTDRKKSAATPSFEILELVDWEVCGGIVHFVNQVMLPPNTVKVDPCKTF